MSTPVDRVPGPDHAADPTGTISPKVIWSTIATLLAAGLLAIVETVQDQPGILGLPDPWGGLVTALLPGLAAFLSGYATRDPLRNG